MKSEPAAERHTPSMPSGVGGSLSDVVVGRTPSLGRTDTCPGQGRLGSPIPCA
jgi:hypothetical protein